MLKSGHGWPDLQRHLTSIKIALKISANFHLVGKSLSGNIYLSLTNCPATAAKLCIKNTYYFVFHFPLLFQWKIGHWGRRLHLSHSLPSASNVGMCFPLSVLGSFVCLKESICFPPEALQDKQNGVPAKSNAAGKARGLEVKSFVK